MTTNTESPVLFGTADLEFLHALEMPEHLLRLRVGIESGPVEGDQQFVRGLKRRETARLRLPLDDVSAGRRARKHDPRQPLQAEARAQHGPDKPPRGVDQEDQQLSLLELSVKSYELWILLPKRRKIQGVTSGIEQHGIVLRVVDQGLHGLVLVKALADMQLAAGQAEMGEPAGVRLDPLEFVRVHEDHELRPRRHGRDRATPAILPGQVALVTHHTTHDPRTFAPPSVRGQR